MSEVLEAKPKRMDSNFGLNSDTRKQISHDLAKILGDTYLLMIKTHVYHWNVVGPLFLPIHELTEQHYENLFKATDEIAERIRALGHVTPLSFSDMEQLAKIQEETSSLSAENMLEQLAEDHEKLATRIRGITSVAADEHDFVTHDMLNARLAFHEQAVWMLRAMLQ